MIYGPQARVPSETGIRLAEEHDACKCMLLTRADLLGAAVAAAADDSLVLDRFRIYLLFYGPYHG